MRSDEPSVIQLQVNQKKKQQQKKKKKNKYSADRVGTQLFNHMMFTIMLLLFITKQIDRGEDCGSILTHVDPIKINYWYSPLQYSLSIMFYWKSLYRTA